MEDRLGRRLSELSEAVASREKEYEKGLNDVEMHLQARRTHENSRDTLTRRAQGTADADERIEAFALEEAALEQEIAARRAQLEEELGGGTRAEGLQLRRAVAEALTAARDEAEQNGKDAGVAAT